MSTFNIILETTLLPNVLVEMIHGYNNFRPTAYLFARSYLKKRLDKKGFKYIRIQKIVSEMVNDFERLVLKLAQYTQNMTLQKAIKSSENWIWNLFNDLKTTMFPIVDKMESMFNPDGNNLHWQNAIDYRVETQRFLIPSLIAFAKGQPWVSPVET
jgi:hypothetical protein